MTRRLTPRVVAASAALAFVLGLTPLVGGQDEPRAESEPKKAEAGATKERRKVRKTDAEWRKQLTASQFWVMRQKGTEPAFSGKYATGHPKGMFACVGCEAPLFSSQHKFNSGTGWPSFWRPVDADALSTAWDYHGSSPRVEVKCWQCDAHLGHVFSDGPPPTGLRYCINSVAIKLKPFEAAKEKEKAKDKSADTAGEAKAEASEDPDMASASEDRTEPAPPSSNTRSSRFRRRASDS